MHSREMVILALRLLEDGISIGETATRVGVPRRTVNDWTRGRLPHCLDENSDGSCGVVHDVKPMASRYAYLLGLYLGDGCISAHARGVFRLRITLDTRYPFVVAEALDGVRAVCGKGAVALRPDHCVEVNSYWKHWPCLFPQHGPGMKHTRPIALADWQEEIVAATPEPLLRGLIHSDGCRAINTGRGGWSHPRYSFSNRSDDIHGIFRAACDRIGIRWTIARPYTTYVSRVADVATLDGFIGPKG